MKKHIILLWSAMALLMSCTKFDNGDLAFTQTAETAEALSLKIDVLADNSGRVDITPTAAGATYYDVYFGVEHTAPKRILPEETATNSYAEGSYDVRVIAYNIMGKAIETTEKVTVSYVAPQQLSADIQIDPTNPFKVNVIPTADYARSFEIYFGEEGENEQPVKVSPGQASSYTYSSIGTYNIRVKALSGGVAYSSWESTVVINDPLYLPITFENTASVFNFVNFDGGVVDVLDNPFPTGLNNSNRVARMVKHPGQVWGGSLITLGEPFEFSTFKTFKMKVYSPRAGAKVLLKVENSSNAGIAFEKEVIITKANEWEELTFDYSAIDASQDYHNLVLIFELGTPGDGTSDFTFYFDDILLAD